MQPPFRVRDPDRCPCVAASIASYGCLTDIVRSKGTVIAGSVDVSSCRGITSLPVGLHVSGDLNLGACLNLVSLPEKLRVGGSLHVSACPKITKLPLFFTVFGDLVLSGCTALASLPEDLNLSIGRSLLLQACTSLVALPETLILSGDLDLRSCERLSRMPQCLRVLGDLYLEACTSITELTPDISVEGGINLKGCSRVKRLPSNLCLFGDLNLEGCFALTKFPRRLRVGGKVTLDAYTALLLIGHMHEVCLDVLRNQPDRNSFSPWVLRANLNSLLLNCPELVKSTQGFAVTGSLDLSAPLPLAILPDGLSIQGNLNLSNCVKLMQLPKDLCVTGTLNLGSCTNLVTLPKELEVGGHLCLQQCTRFIQLPEGLKIGGDLDLSGCSNLISLPQDLVTWGHITSGRPRVINLTGTGISKQTCSHVSSSCSGVRVVSGQSSQDTEPQGCRTFTCLLPLWTDLSAQAKATVERFDRLTPEQQLPLQFFMLNLLDKAHMSHPERTNERDRISQMLQRLIKAKGLSTMLAVQAYSSRFMFLTKCLELRASAQIIPREHKSKLEKLGLGMMKLGVVHQHASVTCDRLPLTDEIDVILTYEHKLRDALELPFRENVLLCEANVTQEELDAAKQAALKAIADPQRRSAFFSAWKPWQNLERIQAATDHEGSNAEAAARSEMELEQRKAALPSTPHADHTLYWLETTPEVETPPPD